MYRDVFGISFVNLMVLASDKYEDDLLHSTHLCWLFFGAALRDGPLINLVNTPVTDDAHYRLITVNYLKANRQAPNFAEVYNNTETKIVVNFSAFEILLHQEAILSLVEYVNNLQVAGLSVLTSSHQIKS